MVTCPHCGCHYAPVRHTQHATIKVKGEVKDVIRRKRVCNHCNVPFTTVEVPEDEDNIGYPDPILYTPGEEELTP